MPSAMLVRTLGRGALPRHMQARLLSNKARPDILRCTGTSFFKFGDSTFDKDKALFQDVTWRIRDASESSDRPQAWAVIGPKAALLADSAILGHARADPVTSRSWPFLGTERLVDEAIKKVAFNTRLESNSAHAQPGEFVDYTARYFSIRGDDEDAITLKTHLKKYLAEGDTEESIKQITKALKLDHLLEIPLVALSNGQTRRARIARALLTKPEVLILEEPFTGLDVKSRTLIAELLGSLHLARSPRIILILRPQDKIPEWVDSIVELAKSGEGKVPAYVGEKSTWKPAFHLDHEEAAKTGRKIAPDSASEVFRVDKANIGYQDRKVLKDITWTLRAGDRVALSGANGSGKSTLLSLILGDHPASYSQSLTLFAKPRSEHSIYSLSKKTGHFSPELFSAFPRRSGEAGLSLYESIGTGFENVFSYRRMTDEQKERIDSMLAKFDPAKEIFTEEVLHRKLFAEADAPLQVLTLIMRAAVKRPELLILDEPFAGLDDALIQRCRRFLDEELEDSQTLIFISHYVEEWPASLGKQLHLEDGRATEKKL